MEATKLGRCECHAEAHNYHSYFPPDVTMGHEPGKCSHDAVRKVTVRPKANSSGFIESDGFGHPARLEVPMCQACADFHEKGGVK